MIGGDWRAGREVRTILDLMVKVVVWSWYCGEFDGGFVVLRCCVWRGGEAVRQVGLLSCLTFAAFCGVVYTAQLGKKPEILKKARK